MNAKTNSLGIVPAVILAGEIQDVDEAVASVALARAGRSEGAGPSAKAQLWLALRSREHQANEYCETLSYVVIWLCRLIGVGLCFL